MLTKFESKSNRVKGLAFHVSRPWILTSLHNGVIQLWDYRMGTLLDRFDEHDGPVRGVDFHRTQPLFVSGGDDYKLKVWDYKLRRCLFTLLGHLDYIRIAQFHHEYPWILSCSDDQTIRIWNWQSRSCISILTGHNHYVMCAQFHPKDDLIVSASLDQTVRVWDTTGLRKKTVRGAPTAMDDIVGHSTSRSNNHDIFGASDAIVKYVLEGHDRGVNWASFHPTLPLIVSGADDRQVKLWRINETKAWEVDTMRGHTNNISCVLFHPRHELIISNSEDRSIRVWDISKRMGLQTFRRENDRFWMLSAHPTQNLLAAGHDSGMIVFKLERERPALDIYENRAYYTKERYIRMYSFVDGSDVPVAAVRRTGTTGTGLNNLPRHLNYNPYDQNSSTQSVLVTSDTDGGSYELVTFTHGSGGDTSESSRGPGLFAVFVARNRFAVLDKSRHIVIKNFQNEVTKKITPPNGTVDGLFFGGVVGRVLLHIDDKMILYETQSRRVLADVQAPRVKHVVWSPNYDYVALISKHSIVLADKQLAHLSTITESVRIKSGIWSNSPAEIFVYTTLNHIKYTLSNGDAGIIRTLDVPVYLTHLNGSKLYCLDREAKMRTMAVDLTECEFKIALNKKNYTEVMRMVRHSRLCGQAIISYLTKKGYPEVALHFVNDEKTRFKLAISCGNLEVALNSAYELDDNKCWYQLGVEALRQGNIQVVEMAYQRTKNFERLSFLYLVTGNRDRLKKMLKIAEVRNDIMGRFHNALYLGDVEVRVVTLEAAGQFGLALLTAATHGLNDHVERLRALLQETNPDFDVNAFLAREMLSNPTLLSPPPCVSRLDSENWALVEINEPTIQDHAIAAEKREAERSLQPQQETGHGLVEEQSARQSSIDLAMDAAGDAWDMEMDGDLDLDDSITIDDHSLGTDASALEDDFANLSTGAGFVAAPSAGSSLAVQWVRNSSLAADHVAAGSFQTAMQLLHRQIGVINFKPLKPVFLQVFSGGSAMLSTQGSCTSLRTWLQRNDANQPAVAVSFAALVEELKLAYRSFTGAKFEDVKAHCQSIIFSIPLLAVDSKEEAEKVKGLLTVCREYLIACRIRSDVATVPLESHPKRNIELSAYFTHCELQMPHLVLTLKIAMTNAFKAGNFITAASFCRRLLEIPEVSQHPRHEKLRLTALKVLQKAEKEARNEHAIDYQDSKPFVLDARNFTPIYLGEPDVRCPYCAAAYHQQSKGSLCDVCGISNIGEETIGLVVTTAQHFAQLDEEQQDSDRTISTPSRHLQPCARPSTFTETDRCSARQLRRRFPTSAFFSDSTDDDMSRPLATTSDRSQLSTSAYDFSAKRTTSKTQAPLNMSAGPRSGLRLHVETIEFPTTRSVLWDRRPLSAVPIEVSLEQILPRFIVSANALKELYKLFGENLCKHDSREALCYLYSDLSSVNGRKIRLQHVKTKAMDSKAAGMWCLPVYSGSTSELLLKNYVCTIKAVQNTYKDEYADSLSSKLQPKLFLFRSSPHAAQLDIQLECVAPPLLFKFTLVRNLPLLMTPLAASLAKREFNPNSGNMRSGYLTLDRTRKAVPLLKVDPFVLQHPVVGIWLYGVHIDDAWNEETARRQLADPFLYFACIGYLMSEVIKERVGPNKNTFLVALYPSGDSDCGAVISSLPRFFECSFSKFLSPPAMPLPIELYSHRRSCLIGVSKFSNDVEFSLSTATSKEWEKARKRVGIPMALCSKKNDDLDHNQIHFDDQIFNSKSLPTSHEITSVGATEEERNDATSGWTITADALKNDMIRDSNASRQGLIFNEAATEPALNGTNTGGTLLTATVSDDNQRGKACEIMPLLLSESKEGEDATAATQCNFASHDTDNFQRCCKSQQLLTIQHQQILENQQRQLHEMQEQITQLRHLLHATSSDSNHGNLERNPIDTRAHNSDTSIASSGAAANASITSSDLNKRINGNVNSLLSKTVTSPRPQNDSISDLTDDEHDKEDDKKEENKLDDSLSSLGLSIISSSSDANLSSLSSSLVSNKAKRLSSCQNRGNEGVDVREIDFDTNLHSSANRLKNTQHSAVNEECTSPEAKPCRDRPHETGSSAHKLSIGELNILLNEEVATKAKNEDIKCATLESDNVSEAAGDTSDDSLSRVEQLLSPDAYLRKIGGLVDHHGGCFTTPPLDFHSFCVPRIRFSTETSGYCLSDSEDEEIRIIEQKYKRLMSS
ncbi:putative SCL-interrupting locus protein [Plasmopara halstedii]